jgi:NDP-sugar pyrophosphorylase family protein
VNRGELKNAEEKLDREFLLLNGDSYMQIDYRILKEHF